MTRRDYNKQPRPSDVTHRTYNNRPSHSSFEVIVRSLSISLTLVLASILTSPPAAFCAPQDRPVPPFEQPQPKDEQRERMEKDMAKRANQQRQAEIKRDTDQLLKLATELKQSVDKSNENILSMDVIKKAEEIEKLAHSVKEKMKAP
jgi:hypothetical protein